MDPRIKILNEGELGSRPNWDEYFMHIAIGVSSRSSCHNVHSGTVIVSDKQILATGYNGAPPRIKNCIETGCRKELKGLKFNESYGSGECIGIHSEMNALGHLTKMETKKIIIYTTIFPCHTCAKNILAYDVDKIVFKRFYTQKEIKSTMDLFEEAGVEVYQLDLSEKRDMDMRYNRKAKFFGVWNEDEDK